MPGAVARARTTLRRISVAVTACMKCAQMLPMIPILVSVADQSSTRGLMVQCLNVVPITPMTRPYLYVYGERKLHQSMTSLHTNDDFFRHTISHKSRVYAINCIHAQRKDDV